MSKFINKEFSMTNDEEQSKVKYYDSALLMK